MEKNLMKTNHEINFFKSVFYSSLVHIFIKPLFTEINTFPERLLVWTGVINVYS